MTQAPETPPAKIPQRGPILASAAALAVAGCLWRGASVPLLGLAGATIIIAAGIWMVLAYLSALRKAHDSLLFRPGSLWRVLAGGHWLRIALALPVALWSALWIALSLVAEPGRTLTGAAIMAVLTLALGRAFARRVDPVITPGQQLRFVIPPVIALSGAAALLLSLLLRAAPPVDLAQAVGRAAGYTGSSALVAQLLDLHALGTGLADLLRGQGWAGLALGLLLDASIWFGLASALALMLIPPGQLGRILAPEGAPRPPGIALAACVALVLIATLLQTAASVEGRARLALAPPPDSIAAPDTLAPPAAPGGPTLPGPTADTTPGRIAPLLLPSDLRRAVEQERIGALLCPPGTIARLDAFEARLAEIYAAQQARLEDSLRSGFDAMRANVPVFLDWYYSLGAEYLRTINLLIGSGEEYLQGQITRHLDAGTPFGTASAELAAIAGSRDMTGEFDAARREILRDCGGDLPGDDRIVTVTGERPDTALSLPLLSDRIAFETRLSAAGFSGLAAGVGVAVLAKIGAKVAISSAFKAAAAALAKIAGSKALSLLGGAGIGAAAGGAGGSVIPGAGTTAGALIGGIVGGAAVMLGVDFTLIKLEEEISRAGFEADLIAAIDATEAEFLTAIGATDPGAAETGTDPVTP